MSCTMFLLMASPSPVPWLLAELVPACSKASKMRCLFSSEIPVPLSTTLNLYTAFCPVFPVCCTYRRTWPPAGVNLKALEIRFMSTCFSRTASPTNLSSLISLCISNSNPCLRASIVMIFCISSTICTAEKGSASMVIISLSILLMSRISLIRLRR